MAHSPAAYDRGTRFTNYSSIHSADAFVGDYQVMYTPGTSPPQPARSTRKSTRFTRPSGSVRNATISQSYILPSNIPNTSQIVPDNIGVLPNVQVRYTIPADEKQIVASLRTLQGELNDAVSKIKTLTKERDDAIHELRSLKVSSRKSSPPKRHTSGPRVEEELLDLSQFEIDQPAKRSSFRPSPKKVSIARDRGSPPPSQNARNLAHLADEINKATEGRRSDSQYKRPAVEDPEQSVIEDPTAASNTSRRRRHHQLDENMTSAYILPDITVAQPAVQQRTKISREAQQVLHSHDPQHLQNCDVCRRLLTPKNNNAALSKNYTAQITELLNATHLDDPTMRPKVSPAQALANVKRQINDQYEHAKQRHGVAWEQYDAVQAPLTSKRHEAIGRDLVYWQGKMEEFRVALDNLRDVEEGMAEVM